jgi:hypothetical protein
VFAVVSEIRYTIAFPAFSYTQLLVMLLQLPPEYQSDSHQTSISGILKTQLRSLMEYRRESLKLLQGHLSVDVLSTTVWPMEMYLKVPGLCSVWPAAQGDCAAQHTNFTYCTSLAGGIYEASARQNSANEVLSKIMPPKTSLASFKAGAERERRV